MFVLLVMAFRVNACIAMHLETGSKFGVHVKVVK
jgi:hypothetical protein